MLPITLPPILPCVFHIVYSRYSHLHVANRSICNQEENQIIEQRGFTIGSTYIIKQSRASDQAQFGPGHKCFYKRVCQVTSPQCSDIRIKILSLGVAVISSQFSTPQGMSHLG